MISFDIQMLHKGFYFYQLSRLIEYYFRFLFDSLDVKMFANWYLVCTCTYNDNGYLVMALTES